MAFIRIKRISGKEYAYLVSNKWRKRLKRKKGERKGETKPGKGSRQKVNKYLGRVLKLDKVKEMGFFEYINIKENADYLKSSKEKIVRDLAGYELFLRGFVKKGKEGKGGKEGTGQRARKVDKMTLGRLCFDLDSRKFTDTCGKEIKAVLEMNEGFLCRHTLHRLLNFKLKHEDEREDGIGLAKAFLEAGLKVPKEIFIGYFQKL
ncbi:hypothetical protein GF323_02020 [Candidatus Woesearchaeota archaeon]|nr:hypothetical protein [Candidatus Woesearchaeota archaeon]